MREWREEVERRLRGAGLDPATERDVAEELAEHVKDRYDELRARGVPADVARAQALAELGEEDALSEPIRRTVRARPAPLPVGRPAPGERLGGWWSDVRFGARMLARAPTSTAVVVVVMALGIAVNTVVFTGLNTVLLRPPPGVAEPEELAVVYTSDYSGPRYGASSYPDYEAIRERRVFESVAAYAPGGFGLSDGARIAQVLGEMVSANYFEVLGVSPAAGRFFAEEEGGPAASSSVVVISHELWLSRFAGAPDAVGSTLLLKGEPLTIIGVAPRDFGGSLPGVRTQLWLPVSAPRGITGLDPAHRGSRGLTIVGRMREAGTLAAVQSGLDALSANLYAEFPEHWTDVDDRARVFTAVPESEARVPPQARGPVLGFMALVMGAVLAILLVACTNVANLQLSRASARRGEMGVRIALGASRGRIVRHLLAESLLLAALGGGAGVLIAVVATERIAATQLSLPISVALDIALDLRVLAFAAGITLLAGLVFGLAPALQASRAPAPMLRDDGRSGSRLRLRKALVVVQVASSLVLLVGGGLFIQTLRAAQGAETGFDIDDVVLARFQLDLEGYTEEQSIRFHEELLDRVRALPGVTSAAVVETVPLSSGWSRRSVWLAEYEPRPGEDMEVMYNGVTPGYFATMGMTLRLGRDFTVGDAAGAPPVAIVSEAFARRFWPGENAIGKRISFEGREGPFRNVIGVAPDATYRNVLENPQPYFYYPQAQRPSPHALLARTRGDPTVLVGDLRSLVRAMAPKMSTASIQTFHQHIATALLPQRIAGLLLSILGGLAVVIAAIGLYGLVAFEVVQRAHEFGVRMALGALAGDIRRMVLGDALRMAVLGIVCGLPVALAVAVLIDGLLMVPPVNPVAFLAVPTLLAASAVAAGYAPARRATRQDPARALHSD